MHLSKTFTFYLYRILNICVKVKYLGNCTVYVHVLISRERRVYSEGESEVRHLKLVPKLFWKDSSLLALKKVSTTIPKELLGT